MQHQKDFVPTAQLRAAARERPLTTPVMFQSWNDLLFLHWEWDAGEIQRTLPQGLKVDCHDGKAYLGVVPFAMRGVRPRLLPSVPGISNFLELNLRTYAYDCTGLPGVWFYSLDADQRLAVTLARTLFSLPYHFAKMQSARSADGAEFSFSSIRSGDASSGDHYRYKAIEPIRRAEPGGLEFFLLERYVLFSWTKRGLRVGRVHHEPYPFRDVELLNSTERLFSLNGFDPPGCAPDHALQSPGVDVSIYALQRSGA